MPVQVLTATDADVTGLADVAARTFPLACPPSATAVDIAAFIAANLSAARFGEYLADPDRTVLVGRDTGRIIGYAMLIRGLADDVELSKMYVVPDAHGGDASAALMTVALDRARQLGAASVWLGVNQQNRRAQRFYAKHGFEVSGTKRFRLGDDVQNDYVMVRPL